MPKLFSPRFFSFDAVTSFLSSLFQSSPAKNVAALATETGNAPAREPGPQQQKELARLCRQLLKKNGLIASGRLQIIGLQKIKKRIGKKWDELQGVVYDIVEAVIRENIRKGDLYLRHEEETYLLIFADADLQQSTHRAKQIATEIQKRLFGVKEPDLKDLTILSDARITHAHEAGEKDMPSLAELLAGPPQQDPDAAPPGEEKQLPPAIKPVYVGAGAIEEKSAEEPEQIATYMPLWDVHNKALTTYLCLPLPKDGQKTPFEHYKDLTAQAPYSARVQVDLCLLSAILPILEKMAEDGRKLFVVCPVHYDTLYRQESFDQLIAACHAIPGVVKERLFFLLIVGLPETLPAKDAFWFVPLVKNHMCRAIFAEIPLDDMPDMQILKGSGIDALGVSLPANPVEADVMPQINDFEKNIAGSGISRSFILNVPSLSLVTTAVCAGMDYLGGDAIHDNVPEPSSMYRYKHEDLISALLPPEG
jgi:hypothetical protein